MRSVVFYTIQIEKKKKTIQKQHDVRQVGVNNEQRN